MRLGCKWNRVTNTLAYCNTVLICISVKEQVELRKFTSAPAILSQRLHQEIHIFGKGGRREEREGGRERSNRYEDERHRRYDIQYDDTLLDDKIATPCKTFLN
jgi:hypothetical protein